MKIDQILFIRNRITMKSEDMIELESLLKDHCDSVKNTATTEDKSHISYADLNEMLKQDNYKDIIIRISLFGVASIEEFHRAIKNAWIEQTGVFPAKAQKFKGFFDFMEAEMDDAFTRETTGHKPICSG